MFVLIMTCKISFRLFLRCVDCTSWLLPVVIFLTILAVTITVSQKIAEVVLFWRFALENRKYLDRFLWKFPWHHALVSLDTRFTAKRFHYFISPRNGFHYLKNYSLRASLSQAVFHLNTETVNFIKRSSWLFHIISVYNVRETDRIVNQ